MMFLSPAQLVELTDRKRISGQIEWLTARGWPFEVSAVGRPKVLVAEMERRMSSGPVSKSTGCRPRLELVK